VEDNFLTQLVSDPTRGGASLDLLLTNTKELVGDVVIRGCFGLSNPEKIEFSILAEVKREGQQSHHHGLSEGRL